AELYRKSDLPSYTPEGFCGRCHLHPSAPKLFAYCLPYRSGFKQTFNFPRSLMGSVLCALFQNGA
ncbi:MAG: hypothetical protein KH420_02890, partial [Clostridiales bacterium]|nr:hypothetical protein [Clostridiales bacterium]